jgi:hypothetical protein
MDDLRGLAQREGAAAATSASAAAAAERGSCDLPTDGEVLLERAAVVTTGREGGRLCQL